MIVHQHFEMAETAVTIIAEEEYLPAITNSIFDSREIVEKCIVAHPEFRWSLEPLEIAGDELIMRMCNVANKAQVGPMAAVAGIIAERAVQAAIAEGCRHCIVDNGGDIAMILEKPLEIGIFAPGLENLGFHLEPCDQIIGICTSSATVGPSISFGAADAAVVIAQDVALADACATRLGNLVTSDNDEIIKDALAQILSIEGVAGAFVAINSKIAMKGTVPELRKVHFDSSQITKIQF